MKALKRIMTAALTLLGLGLGSAASAADLKLGLNSSAVIGGCQVGGVRAGIQEGRFGVYGQAAYCASNVQGQNGSVAFGGGVSFDVYTSGGLTTYALVGADMVEGRAAIHGGLGLRYGVALIPVEGYIEAGVQRVSSALQAVTTPRLAIGVNYRVNIPNLQGAIPAPLTLEDENQTRIQYAGTAPADCKLTPEADVAGARGAASAAVSDGVSAALSGLSGVYSDVTYKVTVTSVSITGNSARVGGSVRLSGTQRSNGQAVSGTYGGTVSLVRDGCGWRATGYTRSGG